MSACRGAAPIERWTRSCRACSSTLRQFPLLSFYGLLFAPEGRASELSRINCRGTLECSEKRKRVPESAPVGAVSPRRSSGDCGRVPAYASDVAAKVSSPTPERRFVCALRWSTTVPASQRTRARRTKSGEARSFVAGVEETIRVECLS